MRLKIFLICIFAVLTSAYLVRADSSLGAEESSNYFDDSPVGVNLSKKVVETYIKLKESIKKESAADFSERLAIRFIDLFGFELKDLQLLKQNHLRKWWSRALESGMEFDSLNEDPRLPLVYHLFYDEDVFERIEKIRIFSLYGGFSISHIEHFESIKLNDTNFHAALKYLENEKQKDEEIVLILLEILFDSKCDLTAFFRQEDSNFAANYAKDYLQQYHSSLLTHLLFYLGPKPSLRLIELMVENNIEIIDSFREDGTQIKIPLGCKLLDKIISMMELQESFINKEHNKDGFLDWESDKTFAHFLEHFFKVNLFSKENIDFIVKLRSQNPILLEVAQWDAIEFFFKIGMVRDKILSCIGETYLLNVILLEKNDQFEEFIKYLKRDGKRYRLIEFSQGLNHLFLCGNFESLMIKAAKNRAFEILSNMLFLLGDEMLKYDQDGNTTLHYILLEENDLLARFESTSCEKKADKIIKLYLFSARLDKESLVRALVMKNSLGETCLSIAAKKGLYRCFETIRKFLLARDAFNQNDHIDLKELNFLLLKGMQARTEIMPIRAIESKKETLDGMIKTYFSLKYYDQDDENHQEFMNLIMRKIEHEFNNHKGTEFTYQKTFRMVRKYFEKGIKSRGFSRAPLAIQMSYYDRPIRMLVKKIIEDFPGGSLSSEKILGLLIDDLEHLPHSLKTQFELLIEDERVFIKETSVDTSRKTWKNRSKWLAWAYLNPK